MIIENTYYKLEIKLKTNLSTTPTLTYKHIEEQYITDVENSTYTTETATSSRSGDIITYTIPFKQYNVGDMLKDFVCTLTGDINIYDLNEGLIVMVDGQETDVIKVLNGEAVIEDNNYVKINPLNDSQFALIFKDTDIHTVQIAYVGNETVGVALSNKEIITPQLRDDSNPEIEGSYLIEFIKYKEKMSYMEDVEWVVRLTKGGVPVEDALIQLDNPVGTYTYRTNANGQISFRRNKTTIQNDSSQLEPFRNWNVGTYNIRARYHYYDETEEAFKELICQTTKKLTITKGTPTLTAVKYAQTKKGTAKFKLKDPQGFELPNIKMTEVVNGKTYNKATNDWGNINFTIGVKGNIKYKFKYAGNKNYNSKNWTFSETIT